MPPASRRLTVCAQPGCPQLTDNVRCPTHQIGKRRTADNNRPNAQTRGYDARWQRERKRYLKAHPWCQTPGCTAPAVDVDHQDGLGPLAPRGYDWDNLQGLCHPCHSRKTVLHDGGYGNPPKPRPAKQPPR